MKFSLSIATVMLIVSASAMPLDGYGQFVKVSRKQRTTSPTKHLN